MTNKLNILNKIIIDNIAIIVFVQLILIIVIIFDIHLLFKNIFKTNTVITESFTDLSYINFINFMREMDLLKMYLKKNNEVKILERINKIMININKFKNDYKPMNKNDIPKLKVLSDFKFTNNIHSMF